jgi:hypothetical protein
MNIQASDSIQKTATDIIMNYINVCNIEAVHAMLKEGEVNLEMKNGLGMTPIHVIYKYYNYYNFNE